MSNRVLAHTDKAGRREWHMAFTEDQHRERCSRKHSEAKDSLEAERGLFRCRLDEELTQVILDRLTGGPK